MRKTDSQRLPFDSGSDLFAGLRNFTAYWPQLEQPSSALLGDVAEDGSLHWESAWIDLGGEG